MSATLKASPKETHKYPVNLGAGREDKRRESG
jgi:hypothetical protein